MVLWLMRLNFDFLNVFRNTAREMIILFVLRRELRVD